MDRDEVSRQENYYRFAHKQWLDESVKAEGECHRSIRKATATLKKTPQNDDSHLGSSSDNGRDAPPSERPA